MMSLRGKSIEEIQAAAREMLAAADRGELTRGDVMNFVIEASCPSEQTNFLKERTCVERSETTSMSI